MVSPTDYSNSCEKYVNEKIFQNIEFNEEQCEIFLSYIGLPLQVDGIMIYPLRGLVC